jgi:hypothetical protein
LSCRTTKDPVTISDPPTTIYRATGTPANVGCDVKKLPFCVTNEGKGKAVRELFA